MWPGAKDGARVKHHETTPDTALAHRLQINDFQRHTAQILQKEYFFIIKYYQQKRIIIKQPAPT